MCNHSHLKLTIFKIHCKSKSHPNIPETVINPGMWISLSKYLFPTNLSKSFRPGQEKYKENLHIKYETIWASKIATVTNESQWIYKNPWVHIDTQREIKTIKGNYYIKWEWEWSIYLAFLVETVFKVSQEPQVMTVFSHWVSKTHPLHFYFGRPTTTHNLTKWKHPWYSWEHIYLLP